MSSKEVWKDSVTKLEEQDSSHEHSQNPERYILRTLEKSKKNLRLDVPLEEEKNERIVTSSKL